MSLISEMVSSDTQVVCHLVGRWVAGGQVLPRQYSGCRHPDIHIDQTTDEDDTQIQEIPHQDQNT